VAGNQQIGEAGLHVDSLLGSLRNALLPLSMSILLAIQTVASADADIIRCSFTEPFVVTSYSTNTSELDIAYDVDVSKNKILKNVSIQIMQPGVFELWDEDEHVVQRLELSYEGSDGMSDFVYPYSVHWIPQALYGGCTSNHQRRR
jgi:uncharacterized membrane protein